MQRKQNLAEDKAALRRAAEARLKEKPASQAPQTEADLRRLHFELEIHQVELEIQNEELRASRAELQTGLARYSELFDFAPIAYFDLAGDGTIRLVNLTGANLVGLGRAELTGRRFQVFLPAPDRTAFNDFLQRVFASHARQACEITWVREDQTRLLAHVEAIRSRDGGSCRLAMSDITERKRAEAEREKLEAQNRQLQKSESLGRMAGAIAHTFNNQLAAVIMNLELLEQVLPSNAGPSATLSEALLSARKAADISTQMLTYLGQTQAQHEPLDLSETCRRSLPLLKAALPNAVILETALPASGPAISANASQIQQVLTNLLTNAWEARRNGSSAI